MTASAKAVPHEYIEKNLAVELADIKLAGAIPGDDVRLSTQGATGALADPFVGTDKPVTLKKISLAGSKADNYAITFSKVTATILKRQVPEPGAATSLVYTGVQQQTAIGENPFYAITDNTGVDVGDFSATVTLLDSVNYRWANSDSNPIQSPWSISPKALADSFCLHRGGGERDLLRHRLYARAGRGGQRPGRGPAGGRGF